MLGDIIEINNARVIVENRDIKTNIMNLYVKIQDAEHLFIGEIITLNKVKVEIKLIGEIVNDKFIYGISTKPSFSSRVDLLDENGINILFGLNNYDDKKKIYLGKSALYKDYPICADINKLFSNHLVILGNTGSGKSCGTARILQNLFYKKNANPVNATFFIIDAYGEYKSAFSEINYVNKDLCYKNYTTDLKSGEDLIQLPLWLLSVDDICLLLDINNKNQIPIVEKALKLVNVFVKQDENAIKYKNSIIASALLDIFISGNTPAQMRDQIFSVLSRYNTKDLNLETPVYYPGYTRPLKQCLLIDDTGKIKETELVINFLNNYCLENLNLDLPDGSYIYTLKDLLYAFDFALIDEGLFSDDKIYGLANELRVRLSSLIDSGMYKFFDFENYFNKAEFFEMLTHKNGQKAQVINLNLNSIDDRFAKVIAKIYSKILFDYAKNELRRATVPIHIVLEEAHRYVQKDRDLEILGYNIFERIAKEGRKYAVMLDLISQRPSELSQTVLSQCNNFIVFKISHPDDIDYIKPMIPYVDEDMIDKIKNLQTGNCLTFGTAFMLPTITKVDLATPAPSSNSCDISASWF